jgi:hypothetical protein
MHPRRLEKNANITLKSAVLPQAIFTWCGEERPDGSNYGPDDACSRSPPLLSGGLEAPPFKYAPRLAADVGSTVDPIVAPFIHQTGQAQKADQSDPAPIVMIRGSGGSLIARIRRRCLSHRPQG